MSKTVVTWNKEEARKEIAKISFYIETKGGVTAFINGKWRFIKAVRYVPRTQSLEVSLGIDGWVPAHEFQYYEI